MGGNATWARRTLPTRVQALGVTAMMVIGAHCEAAGPVLRCCANQCAAPRRVARGWHSSMCVIARAAHVACAACVCV